MDWREVALVIAGLIGCAVALAHGLIIQRVMIRPVEAMLEGDTRMRTARRLLSPMLHFTTVFWFAGGIALVLAPWMDPGARLAVGVLVGGAYLFGAAGNLWATRGRHPGWVLYGLAVALIVVGAAAPAQGHGL